ncbi:hypothetical protein NC651_029395 [Populus alba x Populus x berolinensis]|nr:hypothetical protein NC651_029395 [Populus alba x Populus x berolinensis]
MQKGVNRIHKGRFPVTIRKRAISIGKRKENRNKRGRKTQEVLELLKTAIANAWVISETGVLSLLMIFKALCLA